MEQQVIFSKEKEKLAGAFITFEEIEELNSCLNSLSEYEEKYNIKVKKYYITHAFNDDEPYHEMITDIFEENIDVLLVSYGIDEIGYYADDNVLDKIEACVDVIEIEL